MAFLKKMLRNIENALLCLLLAFMLTLAMTQIVLRLLDSGFFWIDPLLRLLVLWAGLLGAVVACREGQHIAIDLFSRFVPGRYNRYLQALLSLFSSGICFVLTWFSLYFVRDEAVYGGRVLLFMPSWLQNSIFPLAFLLMGLHFMLHSGEALRPSQKNDIIQPAAKSMLQSW